MGEVTIVSPSHQRAKSLTSYKAVEGLIVCVEQCQVEDYRKHNPDVEIVAHPDSVKGIASTRQWIYEKWGDVFMVDDDVSSFTFLGTESGKAEKVTPAGVRDRIVSLHGEAEAIGAFLYGFGISPNPMYYDPMNPLKLTGNVHGNALGMRPSPYLYFHEGLWMFSDIWISGLNAYFHRKILKDTRYNCVMPAMNIMPGGMAQERTSLRRDQSWKIMQENFGSVLVDSDLSEAFMSVSVPW